MHFTVSEGPCILLAALQQRPTGPRPARSQIIKEHAVVEMERAARVFRRPTTESLRLTLAAEAAAAVMHVDDCGVAEALALAASFGIERYGYVVTPNVDHTIRYYYDSKFRVLYSKASYVLLDSRFLVHVLRLAKGQRLHASPGSDVTAALFEEAIKPDDTILVVGGTPQQSRELQSRFCLRALRHIDPPMNLMRDPTAVDDCLHQIEAASPFRFCFLALGSPQQEIIAHLLRERGRARGLALCVGSSINFMTGTERRAPWWMQQMGLEWLFRLLLHPRRMARRYLVTGPRIFWLISRIELRLRRPMNLPVLPHIGSDATPGTGLNVDVPQALDTAHAL